MRKFLTGAIVVTRKIIDEINRDPSFGNFIDESLGKYINCDWGNSPECDKEMNDQAIIFLKNDRLILYVCMYVCMYVPILRQTT